MNAKERVQAVFALQEPDRVPVNYLCNPGIDARLKTHFDLAGDDDEGLRQALGVDFRFVEAPYIGPRLHAEQAGVDVNPQLGFRTRYVEHESGGYWDFCDFPLRGCRADEVAAWPLSDPDDFDYGALATDCERYRGYGLLVGGPGTGDIMNTSGSLFSMEEVYVAMATGDEAVLCFADRRTEQNLQVMERTLEAGKGLIDVLWIGEDLGSQQAPLISLGSFRKYIRPRMQKFVELGRAYNLPVMIHSCGSSSWAFDDFIEMGITAIDTLQPEAARMDPGYLKQTYGDRLAFHGCISTAGVLATGTVEDVRSCVRDTLEVMMPGGGYALAPTHQIQDNSPTANVLAMYEAARELGRYR